MPINHISNKSMRLYLLGQLPDEQTAAVEEEYFCNREFFLTVQSAETALITDYLEGSLSSAEKQAFESRYLQTPLLQQRIEEVRRQRSVQNPAIQPFVWSGWRVVFAVATVLVLGLGFWLYRPHNKNPGDPVAGYQSQLHSVMAVHLSPGLVKGPGSQSAQFEQPRSGSTISLILELPGRSSQLRCMVRISMVDTKGRWIPVWSSPEPLTSSRDDKGQVLILQLGDSLLSPGDYILEAWTPDGEVREAYVYRVTGRQT